jgi:hypothetical protein
MLVAEAVLVFQVQLAAQEEQAGAEQEELILVQLV